MLLSRQNGSWIFAADCMAHEVQCLVCCPSRKVCCPLLWSKWRNLFYIWALCCKKKIIAFQHQNRSSEVRCSHPRTHEGTEEAATSPLHLMLIWDHTCWLNRRVICLKCVSFLLSLPSLFVQIHVAKFAWGFSILHCVPLLLLQLQWTGWWEKSRTRFNNVDEALLPTES